MIYTLCLLLLFTPADTSQVEDLRQEIKTLESRIETLEDRQDIRRGYYLDTLTGERVAYAAILTVIGALFLFLSYTAIKWRIERTESEVADRFDETESDFSDELDSQFGELNREVERVDSRLTKQTSRLENEISEMGEEARDEIQKSVERMKAKIAEEVDKNTEELKSVDSLIKDEVVLIYKFLSTLMSNRDPVGTIDVEFEVREMYRAVKYGNEDPDFLAIFDVGHLRSVLSKIDRWGMTEDSYSELMDEIKYLHQEADNEGSKDEFRDVAEKIRKRQMQSREEISEETD